MSSWVLTRYMLVVIILLLGIIIPLQATTNKFLFIHRIPQFAVFVTLETIHTN